MADGPEGTGTVILYQISLFEKYLVGYKLEIY